MIDLETILGKYRTNMEGNDIDFNGMKIDRLFGLQDLILENLKPEAIVCEIGSLYGHSSMLFAHYCKEVYCVDIFEHSTYEDVFDANKKEFDNIIKIKDNSLHASTTFEDFFFDLVYIDAAHDFYNVVQDVNAWRNKVKKGGILSGHDYHPLHDGHIIEALAHLQIVPDKIYGDSSWIKRM